MDGGSIGETETLVGWLVSVGCSYEDDRRPVLGERLQAGALVSAAVAEIDR
jgi:hypothetical protein